MPISDFLDMMPHTVGWRKKNGADQYGVPTFAGAQTYPARVDFERRNFVNAQGHVVQTRGAVIFGAAPKISPEDRVTLPDGTEPKIMDARVIDDFDGTPHHTEVYFG